MRFRSSSSPALAPTQLPRSLARDAILIAALATAVLPKSGAAQTEIGEITKARTISAPGECPELSAPARAENMDIRRGSAWNSTSLPAKLLLSDVLRKPSALLARASIDAAAHGSGVLYLVPSVECYPGIKTRERVAGALPLGQSSQYEISTKPVRVGNRREQRLAITIERGALVVQWNRGAPLLVLAASDTVTITGTTVAFAVDQTGNQGVVYVQEGSITVNRLPGGSVGAGEIVRLRRGQVPVRALRDPAAQAMNNATQYYSGPAWSLRSLPHLQLGLKGGPTFSNIAVDGNPDQVIEPSRLDAIGGGAFLRFGAGQIAFQTEVFTFTKGYTFPDVDSKTKVSYIEVPVLVRIGLGPGAGVSPYLLLGPAIAFETGCTYEYDNDGVPASSDCGDTDTTREDKSIDLGATGGFGLEMRFGPGSIFAEGRYNHGITNLGTSGFTVRNRSFAVMAGYAFSLGAR